MDVGLSINVSANVQSALRNFTQLTDATAELALEGKGNLTAVSLALRDLRAAQAEVGNSQDLAKVNQAIRDLSAEAKKLRQEGLPETIRGAGNSASGSLSSFSALGLNASQTRVAFLDLARGVTGSGFTVRSFVSNLSLLGPAGLAAAGVLYGMYEILNKTTDAEKKAQEETLKLSKYLKDLKTGDEVTRSATGSEAGNIATVQALVAVIKDSTTSYQEKENALKRLQEINKAYFGQLSLEDVLTGKATASVNAYSQALITQAVIKGQSEEIAKTTQELLKQVHAEDQLRDAYTRAKAEADKPQASSAGNVAGGGADVLNNPAIRQAAAAKEAYEKQRDAVLTLRTAIATYNGELETAVRLSADQKLLTGTTKSDVNGLDDLLKKIVEIKKELAAPDNKSLHIKLSESFDAADGGDQFKLITQNIAKAIAEGAKLGTPAAKAAAQELAALYATQLQRLQNPNLLSRVQGIVEVKQEDVDKTETAIEKAFGTKGLKVKIPVDIEQSIKNDNSLGEDAKKILSKNLQDQINAGGPVIRWTPNVQVVVNKKAIEDGLADQLKEAFSKAISSGVKDGLSGIGEAIGSSIASGKNPVQAAGKAILGALGGLIESIGKALITYGIVKEGLDNVVREGFGLPGLAAIAIGVGAVALGALVKNAGNSYKAFADGGIVTGPTYSLIGEAGPEAIMPLNKVNDFIKNIPGQSGSQNVSGQFTIAGQDLRLVLARSNKNQGLVSGK